MQVCFLVAVWGLLFCCFYVWIFFSGFIFLIIIIIVLRGIIYLFLILRDVPFKKSKKCNMQLNQYNHLKPNIIMFFT